MRDKLFAVTGCPVLHSLSPAIFSSAFASAPYPGLYARLSASTAFEALRVSREIGLSGLNVTSPFKTEMVNYVDECAPEVRQLGALNTVTFGEGKTIGYNTDTIGVAGALVSAGVVLDGREAVVLGAGGAARAAVCAMQRLGARVTLVNRTYQRAQEVGEKFSCQAMRTDDAKLQEIVHRATVIVNAVSTQESLVPAHFFHPGQVVLDARYGDLTEFSRQAGERGARVIEGRHWLLSQARHVFSLFTGQDFPNDFSIENLLNAPVKRPRGVALIGMMGAGKSSVAVELGRVMGREVVDLDIRIEESLGKSISDIFREDGESAFREAEARELRKASLSKNVIVACGGGAVLREENRNLLSRFFDTFWLWARPEEIRERVAQSTHRPLLQHARSVESILAERRRLYFQSADVIIPTEGHSCATLAERLSYEIHSAGPN